MLDEFDSEPATKPKAEPKVFMGYAPAKQERSWKPLTAKTKKTLVIAACAAALIAIAAPTAQHFKAQAEVAATAKPKKTPAQSAVDELVNGKSRMEEAAKKADLDAYIYRPYANKEEADVAAEASRKLAYPTVIDILPKQKPAPEHFSEQKNEPVPVAVAPEHISEQKNEPVVPVKVKKVITIKPVPAFPTSVYAEPVAAKPAHAPAPVAAPATDLDKASDLLDAFKKSVATPATQSSCSPQQKSMNQC